MSWFRFIASDVELEEFCEGIVEKGDMIIIENEDKILNIYKDEYSGDPVDYTKLEHIMGIDIGRYKEVKSSLIDYIKKASLKCNKMEIWSIWLDDLDENIEYLNVKAEGLSEKDVDWNFGDEYFEHPKCLKIYRWTRGPK